VSSSSSSRSSRSLSLGHGIHLQTELVPERPDLWQRKVQSYTEAAGAEVPGKDIVCAMHR
jgi:hypothetical protein